MYVQNQIQASFRKGSIDPTHFVIHSTADPGADANRLMAYWKSGQTQYQVHFTVDWKGNLIQAMNTDWKAYHCGNANDWTFGMEICECGRGATSEELEASWNNAVDAAATILTQLGWTHNRLVSHDYCRRVWGGTTHEDPLAYFKRLGHTWDEYVQAVKDRMENEMSWSDKLNGWNGAVTAGERLVGADKAANEARSNSAAILKSLTTDGTGRTDGKMPIQERVSYLAMKLDAVDAKLDAVIDALTNVLPDVKVGGTE